MGGYSGDLFVRSCGDHVVWIAAANLVVVVDAAAAAAAAVVVEISE